MNKFKYAKGQEYYMVKGGKNYSWDYSKISDILSIHKKNIKTKESAELGNFIIDFDSKNNVVGVSIEHASEFFKEMDISINDLINIKEAIIRLDTRDPNLFVVWMFLKFPNKEKKIPLPTPIMVRH